MDAAYLSLSPEARRARLHSDVVIVDGWGFVSGLQPIDLTDDRVPLPEMVEDQTRQVLANLDLLLNRAGLTKANVVSVRIHLIEFKRFFDRVNAVYAGYFDTDRLPARSCIGVSQLTRGALVEMDFVLRV